MEQNRFAPGALAREAADERASLPATTPGQADDTHVFASLAEEDAYWAGVTDGILNAGAKPPPRLLARAAKQQLLSDAPEILPGTGRWQAEGLTEGAHGSPSAALAETRTPSTTACGSLPPPHSGEDPPTRSPRHDGWTLQRQRIFLDALAETGVVADAARKAGIHRDSAYAYRKRAEGRAFAIAWDAALLLARSAIADDVMSRAREGVVDRIYRHGELVGERHRHDNRLSMAVLTRLDRLASGLGEGAATARMVAGEWDQFMDVVERGGEEAEAFLRARTPALPAEAPPAAPPEQARELQDTAALLARLAAYRKYEAGLAHEIRTADLDPAAMASWTDEQWARAEFSGLLERLPADAWPDFARLAPPATDASDQAPDSDIAGVSGDADGTCRIRRLYRDRHPEPAAAAPPKYRDNFEGCSMWEDDDGDFWTDFPPPPDFDGDEYGDRDLGNYKRSLTPREALAAGVDPDSLAAEEAADLALLSAARDRYFGFAPAAAPESEISEAHEPSGKSRQGPAGGASASAAAADSCPEQAEPPSDTPTTAHDDDPNILNAR